MKKQKGSPRYAGEAGQTLVEILFAFSVSILVVSAIVVVVINSLSNALYTKNQNLANSYAQEGMAAVRQIRDSDWANFSSYTTNTIYCIDQDPTDKSPIVSTTPASGPPFCVQNVDIFSREAEFEHSSDSCMADPAQCPGPTCLKGSEVTVKVSWSDNKCQITNPRCHKAELITCLSNIY